MDEQTAAEVARLRAQNEANEATIAQLIEGEAASRAASLEQFEALSDAERAELYRRAPAHARRMMQLRAEKNSAALIEQKRQQGLWR